MNTPAAPSSRILIIGAGPAGLMAAERLAVAGHRVDVFEKMPSVARKFLMAGRGGLNLTHSEPRPCFDGRYGEAEPVVARWLDGFDAAALTAWADGLDAQTFTGSSGRIFPKVMKASPLLRAWLARLEGLDVVIHTRHNWIGREGDNWLFDTPEGSKSLKADAVILALGGGSYARLGSDGGWVRGMEENAIAVRPLQAANVGFGVAWSDVLRERFAGHPLKNIVISHKDRAVRGEAMIAAYGLEGGAIYALSAGLREAINTDGHTDIRIDLRPDLTVQELERRLSKPRGKNSLSNHLRKTVHLDAASVALMREVGPLPDSPQALAAHIKAVPVRLDSVQGLDKAISSAGGILLDQIDDRLMLKAMPGVFVCGEMLDWEAPTGGYLLQACFASGVRVAEGVVDYLQP
ncbi:TIGR03862 family flavoprotein [Brevundimonas sp. BH3]|uniref:TIGR03862 family flavoprotein n=1 Tax=Brevundimonas sp. BH3 TaxID=3133089 RepID=UPI003254F67B